MHVGIENAFFLNCMFYQLLRVQHSCSSTQSFSLFEFISYTAMSSLTTNGSRSTGFLLAHHFEGKTCWTADERYA